MLCVCVYINAYIYLSTINTYDKYYLRSIYLSIYLSMYLYDIYIEKLKRDDAFIFLAT